MNNSSTEDLLHPESMSATMGIFELSLAVIILHIFNKLRDHFLCTNLGLFCHSHSENCASLEDSCWICWTNSDITSLVQILCRNDLRCFKVLPLFMLSAMDFIHWKNHKSTIFI